MKLHMGCGFNIISGWENLDIKARTGVIVCNLAKEGLKRYDTSSVDFVFSEHFIEHIELEEARCLFVDCLRVLKPEGILRISTPNLEEAIRCYVEKDYSQFSPQFEFVFGAEMMKSYWSWGHKFLYDFEYLEKILTQVGFQNVARKKVRVSNYSELHGLETRPDWNDLVVEARKDS